MKTEEDDIISTSLICSHSYTVIWIGEMLNSLDYRVEVGLKSDVKEI